MMNTETASSGVRACAAPLGMNDVSARSSNPDPTSLRRELGRWDLALLFVVAVLNLNTVASIATSGPVALWLWLAALLCFFLPQGIAVIELSHRYPGEGGLWLWSSKELSIASRCLREIMFSMSRTTSAGTSVRHRSGSRSCQIRQCTST